MPRTVTNPSLDPLPWWLEGDLSCVHCGQVYAVETECRCSDCDQGICLHCVTQVRQSGEYFCVDCSPDARAEP